MQLKIDGDTIAKKTYLGDNTLIDIVIPEDVKKIEDWAFAQCGRLKSIHLPDNIEYIGRNIFAGCDALDEIRVYRLEQAFDSYTITYISQMLAVAMKYFGYNAGDWLKDIGSPAWFDNWDASCDSYIKTQDDVGFMPFLAGGEEDYSDSEHERMIYSYNTRKRKVKTLFRRLALKKAFPINDYRMSAWREYLISAYEPLVDVLKEDNIHVHDDVRICVDEGIIMLNNMRALINVLPEECVELRAIIMNYFENVNCDEDIWDEFEI